MIIPNYRNGVNKPEEIICTYYESFKGRKFVRYLSPHGWSRVCYYFPSKKEAEETFNKFNQSSLPVEIWEYTDSIEQENYFNNWMKKEWERSLS